LFTVRKKERKRVTVIVNCDGGTIVLVNQNCISQLGLGLGQLLGY